MGDLDGDGVPDLAVGAESDGTGGSNRGAVYVQFLNGDGSVKGTTKIASDTSGGPTLSDFDRFGSSVTSVGDLDGDGVPDLAVGAIGDDTGGLARGAVHVLLLNADGTVKSGTKIASDTGGGPTLSDRDRFGSSVTSVGDLDGDGVPDVAVGAQLDDTGGLGRGAVHVLLLNTDGTVKSGTKIASGTNGGPTLSDGDGFGSSVTSVGDLDGDGVPDLAVGADSAERDYYVGARGAVHVLLLNADGTVKSGTKIASDTDGGPTLSDHDRFGSSVTSVGDLDGDGVPDVAVGALADSTGGPIRGAVHVLFLNTDGTVKSGTKIASGTSGGPTLSDNDGFGSSVTSLGDLDGDGVVDLAVGAMFDDTGGTSRGAVHILFLNGPDMMTPVVESISRLDPADPVTLATSLTFRVVFSETVLDVDATDFAVNGPTTGTATSVVSADAGSGLVYDVTVSGGDLGLLPAEIGLDLAAGQDIHDSSGNTLAGDEPDVDETYLIFDLSSPITVDNLDDIADGKFGPGELTLREAANIANADIDLSTIQFDPTLFDDGMPKLILLDNGELELVAPTSIIGPGADKLTIDAQGNSRHFKLNPDPYIDSIWSGFRLDGGRTTADNTGGETTHSGGSIRYVAPNASHIDSQGFFFNWNHLGPFDLDPDATDQSEDDLGLDFLLNGTITEETFEFQPGATIDTDYDLAASSGIQEIGERNVGGVPTVTVNEDDDDTIDFTTDIYGVDVNNVMMYSVIFVSLDEPLTGVNLGVASDDSIQVKVDGEEKLIRSAARGFGASGNVQDRSEPFDLSAGVHQVMVKTFDRTGGHGFRLRLEQDGAPLTEGFSVGNSPTGPFTEQFIPKLILEDVVITNSHTEGENTDGGAIFVQGPLELRNVTLDSNSAARDGGAIANRGGSTVIIDSTITGNFAGVAGGGFFTDQGAVDVTGSTINGNGSGFLGAGLYVRNAFIERSTVANNQATGFGGGIATTDNGVVEAIRATIVGNHAGNRGGGIGFPQTTDVLLHNTIVAGNTRNTPAVPDDIETGRTVDPASSFNLFGDPATAGGLMHSSNGNLLGQDDGAGGRELIPLDGILNPMLADNGGPTETFALFPESPAVDSGSDPSGSGIFTDQRGVDLPQRGGFDIGAFELEAFPEAVDLPFPATYEVLRDGDDLVVRIVAGAELFRKPASGISRLTITGSGDQDIVTVLDTGTAVDTPLVFAGADGPDRFDASTATGAVNLTGNAGNDTLIGGSGNDTLNGGTGKDELIGGAGNDSLKGGGSTGDTLDGGDGNDTLDGGGGNDVIRDTFAGDATLTNTAMIGRGSDTVISVERARLSGSGAAQTIDASGFFTPGLTSTWINGAGGDDFLLGTDGNDLLFGSGGDDDLIGGNGIDRLFGGSGGDTLRGGNGDDLLKGQGGSGDRLTGGNGNDTLNGGRGIDRLIESGDVDFVLTITSLTGLGTDLLQAVEVAELNGGPSGNVIDVSAFVGFRGFTLVRGNGGPDSIIGSAGPDVLNGGDGNDTLLGKGGDDTLNGDDGNDGLSGFTGNDVLNGGRGFDRSFGGEGNDTLTGGNGVDTLIGGDGDDSLDGNGGTDTLVGGTGNNDASLGDVISDAKANIDEAFTLDPLPGWVDQV